MHLDRKKLAKTKHELSEAVAERRERRSKKSNESNNKLDRAFSLITNFEMLSSYLYKLRLSSNAADPLLVQTEDYASDVASELVIDKSKKTERVYQNWLKQYRRIWQKHFSLFLMVLALFVGSCLIGWIVATQYTEYALSMLPQHLKENIIQKNSWFATLNDAPAYYGASIAYNNIRVCINAFVLSAIFGVGGIFILCYNGILFGSIMGFCYVNDFHTPLKEFVLAHGPLELTIIIASTFCGLLFGRVFFMRPYKHFGVRFKNGGKEALIVLTGILPWLVLAGIVEAFISPNENIPVYQRAVIGLVIAIAFWAWTFYPQEPEPTEFETAIE